MLCTIVQAEHKNFNVSYPCTLCSSTPLHVLFHTSWAIEENVHCAFIGFWVVIYCDDIDFWVVDYTQSNLTIAA